jgi:hypothetical protein
MSQEDDKFDNEFYSKTGFERLESADIAKKLVVIVAVISSLISTGLTATEVKTSIDTFLARINIQHK